MHPVEPDHAPSRLVYYLLVVLAVVFVAVFFAFWLWWEVPVSIGVDFARWLNTGKGLYDQGDAARAVDSFQKAVALRRAHPGGLLILPNACLLPGRS